MYGSTIAKRTDCTYSHVIKILKYFEKYNLIKGQKKGRLRLLELTDKGRILAEKLRDISNLF
jgi:DNA-binding MarR family transcriptional regulator